MPVFLPDPGKGAQGCGGRHYFRMAGTVNFDFTEVTGFEKGVFPCFTNSGRLR